MTTLYYKGEDIECNPTKIIKVEILDELVESFLEIYPNYMSKENDSTNTRTNQNS
jgi:hypothetical protein